MQNKRNRWIIALSIVAVAVIGISLLSVKQYSVYFYTTSEAKAQAMELSMKEIRVGGMVKAGTVQWKPESLSLTFILTDLKGAEIEVFYHGSPPDMFKENSGAVVEGRITQEGVSIHARNLLVKHSEEYRVPSHTAASVDKELLEKSMFKGAEETK